MNPPSFRDAVHHASVWLQLLPGPEGQSAWLPLPVHGHHRPGGSAVPPPQNTGTSSCRGSELEQLWLYQGQRCISDPIQFWAIVPVSAESCFRKSPLVPFSGISVFLFLVGDTRCFHVGAPMSAD